MNKQRLDYIDFAKGFAILSIVIFHFSQPYVSGIWSKAIMIGGSGAHLFFVLSAFGLGLSSKVSTIKFYKKRFLKILIPYYSIISIIYIINIIYPIYKNDGGYAFWGHILFYKMFDEDIMTSFGYHFWFLSTIIQFYIFFPLIFIIKEKLSVTSFIAVSLLISILYWIVITYFDLAEKRIFNSFFLQYLWEFNIGLVLADYYKDKNIAFWDKKKTVLFFVAIIGILVMALMAIKGGVLGKTFNDIPASIGYISLSAFLFSVSTTLLKHLQKFLIFVGKISYELYLIHMVTFLLLREFITMIIQKKIDIFISLGIILPLSILLSYLIHKILTFLSSHIKF